MNRKIISLLLTLCLLSSSFIFTSANVSASSIDSEESYPIQSNLEENPTPSGVRNNSNQDIQNGTILHCFNWKYKDIIAELPNIQKAGFTAVQTSPAQDSYGRILKQKQWYWLYQPLGFHLGNNGLGSRKELKSLCAAARTYGIKVIVDVVANHLAIDHTHISSNLKNPDCWHTPFAIRDFNNRYEITHGSIGMPDLNTEHPDVQKSVENYVQSLKLIGVSGIRWDAAKHISLPSENTESEKCNFWPNVIDHDLYNYGEILGTPDNKEINPTNIRLMKEYAKLMSVTDSEYGKWLRNSFAWGHTPDEYGNWSKHGIPDNKLVYWAENHDTWSNNKESKDYSNEMSQEDIDRAYAVAASRNKITALYFSRPSSKDKEKILVGQKGSTHFTSPAVSEINHFHNDMDGQRDYYAKSHNCSVICRKKGAVVVKGARGGGSVIVVNGGHTTTPGTYRDRITGNTWNVTRDTMKGIVGPTGIAVLCES